MKIRQKFLILSIVFISFLSAFMIIIGIVQFSRESGKLNKELFSLKVASIIDLCKQQNDYVTDGKYADASEAQNNVMTQIKYMYEWIISESKGKNINEEPYPAIITTEGTVIMHPVLETGNTNLQNADFIQKMIKQKEGEMYYTYNKVNKYAYFASFPEWNWIVMYQMPLKIKNETVMSFTVNEILFSLIVLILFSVLFYFTIRNTLKPLQEVSGTLKNISQGGGDLTKRILIDSRNEIGELSRNFNSYIKQLNDDLVKVESVSLKIHSSTEEFKTVVQKSSQNIEVIQKSIGQINVQTESSTSGIEELTATIEEMSRNIDSIMNNMVRQASAVEEGASSIEEMVRNIENTTAMSKKTHDLSNNLNNVANEGGSAVKTSIQSIREVAEYSQQILKLLGLITNIAKQTNLLAMNAAIEAAHAGEAGKGFAIVADEIRRLSEDTNKNAKDIGDVVGTIVGRIDESVKLAEKAGLGLDMITTYSQQNVQIISQLNLAMSEQNNGAREILKATQEIVKITEEVKLAMVEQKGATDDFSEALKELRNLSINNKGNIMAHLETINSLIKNLEELKRIIVDNQNHSDELSSLVKKFILEKSNTGEESTGLKLVE